MTPAAPHWGTVGAKLRIIAESLDDLASLGDVTEDRLQQDRVTRAAVERWLSRIVDVAVDINTHIAASQLGRAPASYRESFGLAARADLITPELATELEASAGLRNAIVHTYVDLDLRLVAAAVPRALDGYRRYVTEVARRMQELRDAED